MSMLENRTPKAQNLVL
uniref:Uncharacterized protein n=1 Tax=Anguilla anguilla TaxID=7936 RepID=A0A0E9TKT1_ANGAN